MEKPLGTSITLTFRNPQSPDYHLHTIVRMAVNEYWSRRSPPETYVQQRYAHLDQKFRDAKVPQIERATWDMAHCELGQPVPAFLPTPTDPAPHCVDMLGAEYIDFNDAEYLALMQHALLRIRMYHNVRDAKLCLAARDKEGWLEFILQVWFRDMEGDASRPFVVGFIQRNPGAEFESHS